MAKLTDKCPFCSKTAELISSFPLSKTESMETYSCGHTSVINKEHFESQNEFKSVTGTKEAFPYQKEGVNFILQTGFNAMIGDQMGLGKTIQALLALKNGKEKVLPCLILLKSATTWQWHRESKEWYSNSLTSIFVIEKTSSFIPPGFDIYLLSMDMIGRAGMVDKLLAMNFKLCIVDEAHSFKNPESKRSQSLMQFFKRINEVEIIHQITFNCPICREQWSEEIKVVNDDTKTHVSHNSFCPRCNAEVYSRAFKEKVEVPERKCHVILLTGTPIINRADEYFIPLNILAPREFPSLDRFRKNWLMQDEKGKWSRVQPYVLDKFREKISAFVIRRERKEVLKDLPPFQRTFTTLRMEQEDLKKLYQQELDRIALIEAREGSITFQDVSDSIAAMRRLTAMAKVPFVTEYVGEFLDETEQEKICIGIHHVDVRKALKYTLRTANPLTLSGEDNAIKKDHIVNEFRKESNRVLIANILAGGVGLNLQFCNNALIVERQWAAAHEEQFEGRFNRPGQDKPVTAEYLICKNTIDEFFHNIVENKRDIFGETVDNDYNPLANNQSVSQFIDWSMANKV